MIFCVNHVGIMVPIKSRIHQTSSVFCFVLNHFSSNGKDNTKVSLPLHFKVNSQHYTLAVVFIHHGNTLDVGHYSSLLKQRKGWIHINNNVMHTYPQLPYDLASDAYIASY